MKVVIYSSDKFPLSRFVSLITCTLLDVLLVSLDSSELAELGTLKISGVVLTRVHQKRELKRYALNTIS